jgi:hypothetical protein
VNGMRRSFIACLFFVSRPSHVARFVVTIIINSVDGMFRSRTITDIIKKRNKIVLPFFAHFYSTASIVFPGWIFAVRASLNHTRPISMRRGYVVSPCMAVFPRSSYGFFNTETAAAFSFSFSQQNGLGNSFLSAIALTNIASSASFGIRTFQNKQSAKSLTDVINQQIHRRNYAR